MSGKAKRAAFIQRLRDHALWLLWKANRGRATDKDVRELTTLRATLATIDHEARDA